MKLAAGYTFSDVDGQAGNIVLAQKLHDLIEKATLTEKVSQNDLDDGLKTLIGLDAEGNIAIRVDQLSDELKAELGIVEGETALSRTHLSQDLQDLLFIEYDEDTETYMMKIPASALPEFTLEDLGVTPGKGLEFDEGGLIQVTGWVTLGSPVTVVSSVIGIDDQQTFDFDLTTEPSIPDDVFELAIEVQGKGGQVIGNGQSVFGNFSEDTDTQNNVISILNPLTLVRQNPITFAAFGGSWFNQNYILNLDHIKIIGYRY